MKFKAGDKVRIKTSWGDFKVGDIRTLIDHHHFRELIIPNYNGDKEGWFVSGYSSCIELVKSKELNNETDYLDAFKDNFKDGV